MDFIPKPDTLIAAQDVDVERKHYRVELRENVQGRFLRITETAAGRRNAVIIPEPGIGEFMTALQNVAGAGSAVAAQA
jgi:hypothetical protein